MLSIRCKSRIKIQKDFQKLSLSQINIIGKTSVFKNMTEKNEANLFTRCFLLVVNSLADFYSL